MTIFFAPLFCNHFFLHSLFLVAFWLLLRIVWLRLPLIVVLPFFNTMQSWIYCIFLVPYYFCCWLHFFLLFFACCFSLLTKWIIALRYGNGTGNLRLFRITIFFYCCCYYHWCHHLFCGIISALDIQLQYFFFSVGVIPTRLMVGVAKLRP